MSDSNIIGSVIKSVNVLGLLAEEPFEYTAIEISKSLGLNRTTVHRILATLVESRMAVQDPASGKYKVGPESYRLGMAYKHTFDSEDLIQSIIAEAGKELRMSVGYSIKDGMDVISVYDFEQYASVRFGYSIGSKWPLYRGASGRSVIAFHEPFSELEELVQGMEMEKITENTITDPKVLLEEFKRTRERGYAISDGESLVGAYGIGYPVRDRRGQVMATVSIAAIRASMTDERIEEVIEVLKRTAERIEKSIL